MILLCINYFLVFPFQFQSQCIMGCGSFRRGPLWFSAILDVQDGGAGTTADTKFFFYNKVIILTLHTRSSKHHPLLLHRKFLVRLTHTSGMRFCAILSLHWSTKNYFCSDISWFLWEMMHWFQNWKPFFSITLSFWDIPKSIFFPPTCAFSPARKNFSFTTRFKHSKPYRTMHRQISMPKLDIN